MHGLSESYLELAESVGVFMTRTLVRLSLVLLCVLKLSSRAQSRPIDWSDSTQHLALAFGGLARPDPTTGIGHRTEEYAGKPVIAFF